MSNQKQIPILSEHPKPKLAEWRLVEQCRDELDAIRLCMQLSSLSHEAIGGYLGIDKGHLCRTLQGRAHFPTSKRMALMTLCGNLAPLQYEAMRAGMELVDSDVLAAVRTRRAA
jgi:hypothetical protein